MRKKFSTLLVSILLTQQVSKAQFAPQAGIFGSSAIAKTSTTIKAWGTNCSVQRGFVNIQEKSLDTVSAGVANNAIGAADGTIVSLGDSGVAVVQFEQRIYDGPGPDFVVFENGFSNPANPEEAYLELAFVEVSSDGHNYFRFPATSNTNTTVQIDGVGTYLNARHLNNLAGKYISGYGTPFDLSDLSGIAGLDVDNVSHVRIVDVVGSIDQWGSRDHNLQIINDPFPTPFPTGGFDLDAVGAIHIKNTSIKEISEEFVTFFPNPATERLWLNNTDLFGQEDLLRITDITGKTMVQEPLYQLQSIDISTFQPGLYLIYTGSKNNFRCIAKCSKI